MLRAHLIDLPDLPPDADDDLLQAEVDRRFSALVHSLSGDWKPGDALTATKLHDGLDHDLVLSAENETLDVSVSVHISDRQTAASAIPGLLVAVVAVYFGHDVLRLTSATGMAFTLAVAAAAFVVNWYVVTRVMFVGPRVKDVERAFNMLDGEVTERLANTPGIVTRT